MAHVQQQILDGIVEALKAAGTAAGPRVFLDRLDPLQAIELPALLVEEAPQGEDVNPQTVSGSVQRVFSVLVSCVVAHATDYGRNARALGLEVELVLGARTFPHPKPGRSAIAASRMNFSGEGDRALALREQLWRFTYTTRRDAPETAL